MQQMREKTLASKLSTNLKDGKRRKASWEEGLVSEMR